MAIEGTVNNQITDSVTQVDATVLGHAPAQTTGMLDAVMAESIGMAMYNAVTTQHNSQMVASAAVAAACARMLKSPSALPLLPKSTPAVTAATPNPVPVNADPQNIQVTGSNFQPNLSVDLFDSNGNKISSLSGTQQITAVTSTGFTLVANLSNTAGVYGIEVVNPDGGRSPRYPITAVLSPVVNNVKPSTPAAANSYQVSGSNFSTKFTVNVFDQTGTLLSPSTVSAITTTSFTMVIVPEATSTGPFSVEVVNPDGTQSNPCSFAA